MQIVKQYEIFEIVLESTESVAADFCQGDVKICTESFLYGEGKQAIRFMPHLTGEWNYRIEGKTGSFFCMPAEGVHGRVFAQGFHFRYEDGTPYYPFGTTCYAWTSQQDELVEETIETLKDSPFNKIRMCIFPKSMPYNNNEPPYFPFERDASGQWDVKKPDFRYWNRLDRCLCSLRDKGIEADIILFHPYDRWGFSKLGPKKNREYLKYCIARLAAYRNVWWSLANEYQMVVSIQDEEWDKLGRFVSKNDPYGHLISVHDWIQPFPKKDWLTHASIQSDELRRVASWRQEYGLPVIIDECGYEGDILYNWGNLSGFEFINRAWSVAAVGGYVTHGETFHCEDEVLWWAKGGKLYGQAPARFAFLRDIIEEIGALDPVPLGAEDPNGIQAQDRLKEIINKFPEREKWYLQNCLVKFYGRNERHRLYYLARECPCFFEAELPRDGVFRIEVIDVWRMTRETVFERASGTVRVPLPAKEGMAVLATLLTKKE